MVILGELATRKMSEKKVEVKNWKEREFLFADEIFECSREITEK